MSNPATAAIWLFGIFSFLAPVQLASASDGFEASCGRTKALGVTRTVTLDTKGGARFGKSHGGAREFLKEKEVVLTFDDGPAPGTTTKVLHELDRHCAKATFFMVGRMVKHNGSLARKVAAKGHTVAPHTHSHNNLAQISNDEAIEDVNRGIRVLRGAVGESMAPFFRFPYLSENQAVNRYLARRNYGVFAVDVDSKDYKAPNAEAMVNRVMTKLAKKGKGIILLHDIKKVTARGIGMLLDRLHEEGYRIVHIKGKTGAAPDEPLLISDAKPEGTVVPSSQVAAVSTNSVPEIRLSRKKIKSRILVTPKSTQTRAPIRIAATSGTRLSRDNYGPKIARSNFRNIAFRKALKKRIIN